MIRKKFCLAGIALLLSVLAVHAVPAKPGVKKVVKTADGTNVEVELRGDEHFSYYKAGDGRCFTIDAMGATYNGKVVYVSPAMSDESKSYLVRISLDVAKGNIKAGLFARTSLDILQRRDTLFAPKDALLSKNGKTTVFVYNPDTETVEEREITIGLINDDEVEILTGINEGEIVAVSSIDRLKNGGRVTLESPDEAGDGN